MDSQKVQQLVAKAMAMEIDYLRTQLTASEAENTGLKHIKKVAKEFMRDYWLARLNEDNGAEAQRLIDNLDKALQGGE